MYRSFSIKNFRCFDELTVEGMGRINLIAGKNNVGKTALLEALWVHGGAPNLSWQLGWKLLEDWNNKPWKIFWEAYSEGLTAI